MSYVGRFAPSPTGPLHFGSLVAAVASYLDARSHGGRWHVRIEDIDAPRTVPGAAESILATLAALGFAWDGPVQWQGARLARYAQALATLEALGAAYRCRCSRKEIFDSGLSGIEGFVYAGTCRDAQVGLDEASAVRVLAGDDAVRFEDRVQGCISQRIGTEIGDFIVKRRDGLFAYQLAVVVDDGDLGVTDVVRGADLLLSTPRQVRLQQLLGLPTPRYLHVPVATHGGQKLSKQTLAKEIGAADPQAQLARALAFLGQEPPVPDSAKRILEVAATRWDIARIPRALSVESAAD
jgi:glutamyl-Q tRNA(Asp) synthetase